MQPPDLRLLVPDVAVLIPCYNEELSVGKVVHDFLAILPHARIYVYDNNSTDDTARVAAAAGAIVRHEEQQGKGHVVRRMFRDIDADWYVLVDGDDTYEASTVVAMLKAAVYGPYDLVNGVRISAEVGDEYRPGHRFGNTLLTGLVKRMFGDRVRDMLSGYKVVSRRFVKSFPVLSSGFEIETELTVHALELDLPIAHIECSYRGRRKGSTSKLNSLADGRRIGLAILNLYRQERPLTFFMAIAILLAIISIVLGVPIIVTFLQIGLVPRIPTAILALGIMLLAFASFNTGLILDTVTRGRREAKLLRYLSVTPIVDTSAQIDAANRRIPALAEVTTLKLRAQPSLGARSRNLNSDNLLWRDMSHSMPALTETDGAMYSLQSPLSKSLTGWEVNAQANASQVQQKKPIERTVWFNCILAVTSFLFFAAITSQIGKDVGFDLLNYHYYNGFALFTGAWQRDIVPAQTQTFINPEPDLLTYVLIKNFPPIVAGMVMGGLQGLNFWLIFAVSSYVVRFRKHTWLQWPIWFACAALGMYAPAVVSELGNFMQDLFTAVFVTAGVALAFAGLTSKRRSLGTIVIWSAAGLSLGIAAGLKLTNVPFAIGAAVAFVPTLARSRWVQMGLTYCSMAIGFLLGGGYWAWNLWVRYRNPLFLSFNAVFKSPYALPIDVNDPRFFPTTLKEWLFYPFYFRLKTPAFPLELPFQDYSIAVCFVLVFLAATVAALRLLMAMRQGTLRIPRLAAGYTSQMNSAMESNQPAQITMATVADRTTGELVLRLVIFSVVSYVLWELMFGNYRYLTPLVILAPVLIAAITSWLISEARAATLITLVLFVCIALTAVQYDWGRSTVWGNSYFGVQVPQFANPAQTLILMNTAYVDGYIIPAFPDSVTVIRIESGGEQYYTSKFDTTIQQHVDSFRGAQYLLTAQVPGMSSIDVMISHANQNLATYGRQVEPGSCQLLSARVEPYPTYLCRVQQKSLSQKSVASKETHS